MLVPLCNSDSNKECISSLSLQQLNIVYLGALTGNYDFESLIQLFIKLESRGKNAKLFIIGDGHKKDWLLNKLTQNHINFEFLGRVYDDQVKGKVFDMCHFGFNGFKENAAIALSYKSMEYMSNGLALINSSKEDTWNIVEQYNIGINYHSNNIDKLVSQILELSDSELIEMRNKALKIYNKDYSYSAFCERMDTIFEPYQTK